MKRVFVCKKGKFIRCSRDSQRRCAKRVSAWKIRNEKSFFLTRPVFYVHLPPPLPLLRFSTLYISCSVGGGIMFRLMVIELLCRRVWNKDFTWDPALWRPRSVIICTRPVASVAVEVIVPSLLTSHISQASLMQFCRGWGGKKNTPREFGSCLVPVPVEDERLCLAATSNVCKSFLLGLYYRISTRHRIRRAVQCTVSTKQCRKVVFGLFIDISQHLFQSELLVSSVIDRI